MKQDFFRQKLFRSLSFTCNNPHFLIPAASPSAYLEANLFFSFLDLGLAVKGSSLTGVRSLITLFSFLSSLPIWRSFLGLGVRSSTSVLRDFFAAYFPVLNVQKNG